MRHFARITLLLTLLTCCAAAARAQDLPPPPGAEYDPKAWKEFTSQEGRFSVLFPGVPQKQSQQIPTPDGKLMSIVIHTLRTFAEYGVIYADYPFDVTGPDMARRILDDSAKGAVAEVQAELLSVREISLDGRPGRALKERLPNGQIMHVRVYLAGSRLYQVAITIPPEESAPDGGQFYRTTAAKFLDSFKLLLAEAMSTSEERTFGFIGTRKGDALIRGRCEPPQCRPAEGELKVGSLLSKPEPEYPKIAKAARATGTVTVQITVDEEGKVIDAAAVSGHPLLQAAAVKAAHEARYAPTLLDGKPVKVTGALTYNFVLQ